MFAELFSGFKVKKLISPQLETPFTPFETLNFTAYGFKIGVDNVSNLSKLSALQVNLENSVVNVFGVACVLYEIDTFNQTSFKHDCLGE